MVQKALDRGRRTGEARASKREVIDLRTLVPLDREAIVRSVAKTGRLLVADEDYLSFGLSGEVFATAIEGAFDHLDAPPARLAYPDVPIPYSRPLEQFCLPNRATIAAAARQLMR